MRRLLLLALLLTAALWLFAPAARVSAETWEWTALEPKPAGVNAACSGYAEAGGHSYRYGNWVGDDPDRAWMQHECKRILEVDMVRRFAMAGVTLDPSTIRVLATP